MSRVLGGIKVIQGSLQQTSISQSVSHSTSQPAKQSIKQSGAEGSEFRKP